MALLNFEQQRQRIVFANDFDVCSMCKIDLAKEKGITIDAADTLLRKKLTGEKVFKLSIPTVCLCASCIKKINNDLNKETVKQETIVQSEAVEEATENNKKATKEKANEKGKNKK